MRLIFDWLQTGLCVNLGSTDSTLDTWTARPIVRTMPMTPKELAQHAMDLSWEGRVELADLLVESLGAAQSEKLGREWLAVARRRRDELRSGQATTLSAGDALQQVRDSLKS